MQKRFPPRRIWVAFKNSIRPQRLNRCNQIHRPRIRRASTDINSSNLDSNEALIGESKQGTQNDNVETSSSRTRQEQDYKRKEDEVRFREENHFNPKSSLMYSMPWLQAVNAWTKLYVGYTENAFMMTDYWLELISTIWLGKDKKRQSKGTIEK